MSDADLPSLANLEPLRAELRELIATIRQRLSAVVNAEISRLYWTVGQRLANEVLGGERAQYGAQLMPKLVQRRQPSLAGALKPRTYAAWCSLPRLSRCPRMSHH